MQPAIADSDRRPNLVVIMADDLGYECLGCNGSQSYQTPRLNELAASGMRFEQCHSQPICTPSRVQIMTGLYNQRNYVRFGLLDPGQTTFAQLVRKAGYRTCIAGKWQLDGGLNAPDHFGFDEYCLWQLNRRPSRYPNPGLEINGKQVDFTNGEYGPDITSNFICDFITKHKDEPFLVWYPMILPHWPFEPTPDSTDWDPQADGVLNGTGRPKYFKDMVAYTDKMVGRIVDCLDSQGLRDNTLILFTGDNGTATQITSQWQGRTVTGGKGNTTNFGTRVPMIANWPGTIRGGQVNSHLVDFSDYLPTIVEATKAQLPDHPIDGRSFLPLLLGRDNYQPRQWSYCWYARNGGPTGAEFARTAEFKLYRTGKLFDVRNDDLEQHDLSGTDRVPKQTRELLQSVLDQMLGTRRIPSAGSAAANDE